MERERLTAEVERNQRKKKEAHRERSGADGDRVIMERLRRERDEALREVEKWKVKEFFSYIHIYT